MSILSGKRYGGPRAAVAALAATAWLAMVGVSSAATTLWTGGSGSAWSTGGNWSGGVAPANGDDLAFTQGDPASQPDGNDLAGLSPNSLLFVDNTFLSPLTLAGNALALGSPSFAPQSVALACGTTGTRLYF
jgi:hypothetical protein